MSLIHKLVNNESRELINEWNAVIRASEVFAKVGTSLKMNKMESVSMLNLNMGTVPSFPCGLLLFFLFFSDYLQFLLPFCDYSDWTEPRGIPEK